MEPVPDHLVHECDACGRTFVTGSTAQRYDATGHIRGYGGYCHRDQDRIKAHGTPVTSSLHRAEHVTEEVQHLVNLGTSRGRAVEQVAASLGLQVESVQRALLRAARRQRAVAA